MKRVIIILILCLLLITSLNSGNVNNPLNLRGPQQYGVFFINQLPPEYLEDYYLLYNKRLYYNEDNIRLNIAYLERGLTRPFRKTYKALCSLKTKEQTSRYRYLLIMDIYLKIMQDYLNLAALYDMKNIYFFHDEFKQDIKKSLGYARFYYNQAKDYWKKVLQYAEKAKQINAKIEVDSLENKLYLILNREKEVDWDYDYTINLHLTALENNIKKLNN